MAVRSLMAQEKNMSASQPHSFLLRSLYHILYALFCFLSIYIQIFSIPIACTQKFSPENITFPKTKSVIFPILNFFYFPSTQIDFFVG